jgi:hypothetical protein
MGCLDTAATGWGIRTMFDGQQFRECPRRWTEFAAAAPIENTRRTHIEQAGSLPLA